MVDKTFIPIGKIASTYGVHGWVKIYSYTKPQANILDYIPWYFEDHSRPIELKYQPINIEDKKIQNQTIIIKIMGIDTPEKARLLTGKTICMAQSQLPKLKLDEYYWSDLEGLTVENEKGINFGKVVYLIETGSNDVLVVKGKKEIAIPYLPGKVIKKIDLDQKIIIVDWEEL